MDAATLKGWRYGLLVILVIEAAVLAYTSWSLQRFKPITEGNWVYLGLASSPAAMLALYAVALIGLIGFLGPRGRLPWGFVALVAMKVLLEVFATIFSAHHQDFYQSGAILFGFVLGELYAYCIGLREGRSRDEWLTCKQLGATAAIAIFGATYVAAGTSKIIYGGLSWIDSSTLRLMVAAHTEVGTAAWKDAIGHWVAANPLVCASLQIGTVIIQVGSFLLVVNRLRTLWATLIVLFHIGIYLPSNILFLQPLIFAAIVAFPWRWLAARFGKETKAAAAPPRIDATAEQITAGQATWLKIALAMVAASWLVSPGFERTDLWGHLWMQMSGVLGG